MPIAPPYFETVSIPPDRSLLVFDRRLPEFPFNWHYHPEFELTLSLTEIAKPRSSASDGFDNFYWLQPEGNVHALVFKGRSTSVQSCAAESLTAQLVPPSVADASRHIPRQSSGFLHVDIEKLRRFDRGADVRVMPVDRADPGFHLGVPPGLRIDVEERRKTPKVLPRIDEAVVLQVVIRVGDKDPEYHPAPDFQQIIARPGRDGANDVGDFRIKAACVPNLAKGCACRDIGDPAAIPAIKTAEETDRVRAARQL